jgi:hypothetical protein
MVEHLPFASMSSRSLKESANDPQTTSQLGGRPADGYAMVANFTNLSHNFGEANVHEHKAAGS